MLYYLIFLNEGIVISISRFDNEEARDKCHSFWKDEHNIGNTNYDELQIFNEID